MQLRALTLLPTQESYRHAYPCLQSMLRDDTTTAFLPLPTPADSEESTRTLASLQAYHNHLAPHTTLIVATSGTTGTPKYAQLGAHQLRASATATHHVLGGPGAWLLPLPPYHIAGIQVLLRSLAAGYEPVLQDTRHGFALSDFAAATTQLLDSTPHTRHYTSLVPTQLHKIVSAAQRGDADGLAARTALTYFDAILVGGAALSTDLLHTARTAGAHIVCTYGASETAGGCVYDGYPLPGTRVDIDEEGRIWLGGDTIASGYLNMSDHIAWRRPGWFRTDDHGHWNTSCIDSGRRDNKEILHSPRLCVDGRLDDAICSGGLTIFPHVVENALATHPAISQVVVIGKPDARLGEHVTAVIVPAVPSANTSVAAITDNLADALTVESLRHWVSAAGLPPTAAPREVIIRADLPVKGIGKIDRRHLRDIL